MRSAFFGTPPAAVPALLALAQRTDVRIVVTQPDRPRGRSGRPQPPAVKEAAGRLGIQVAQPGHPRDLVGSLEPVDLGVLVAYGHLIPPELLTHPEHGMVNIHFSLLPRWRGAAPVAHALLAGDDVTGVTLMEMGAAFDTGAVLASVATPIRGNERAGDLTERLAELGGDLLASALPRLSTLTPNPQDPRRATAAPKISAADARVDPATAAESIWRQVRAFHPRPGAWLLADGERFKLHDVRPVPEWQGTPGQVTDADGRPVLATASGGLELVEVQPQGKGPMLGTDWWNGRRRRPIELG